jgi:hypothetical protein
LDCAVEKVALYFRRKNVKVFYDNFERHNLWGENLYLHLSNIYSKKAKCIVVFISRFYAKKLWTMHELASAQSGQFSGSLDFILPARFDDAEVPGVLPITGYIDLRFTSSEELGDLIIQKLNLAPHKEIDSIGYRKSKILYKNKLYITLILVLLSIISNYFFDFLNLIYSSFTRIASTASTLEEELKSRISSAVSCEDYRQRHARAGQPDQIACNKNTSPGFYWKVSDNAIRPYGYWGMVGVGKFPACGTDQDIGSKAETASFQNNTVRFDVREYWCRGTTQSKLCTGATDEGPTFPGAANWNGVFEATCRRQERT